MNSWNDFNDANDQSSFDLIPKGTAVRVRLTIRPGNFDDAAQGWDRRLCDAQCQHRLGLPQRRVRGAGGRVRPAQALVADRPLQPQGSGVGQHGPVVHQGDAQLRARHPSGGSSPQAQNARRISGFADLDGLEFLARIDWEKDQHGQDKAVIKQAIQPDHRDYAALMGSAHGARPCRRSDQLPRRPRAAARTPVAGRPSWAQ